MKYTKLSDSEFKHFSSVLRENLDLYAEEDYLIEYWKSEWTRRVIERAEKHWFTALIGLVKKAKGGYSLITFTSSTLSPYTTISRYIPLAKSLKLIVVSLVSWSLFPIKS